MFPAPASKSNVAKTVSLGNTILRCVISVVLCSFSIISINSPSFLTRIYSLSVLYENSSPRVTFTSVALKSSTIFASSLTCELPEICCVTEVFGSSSLSKMLFPIPKHASTIPLIIPTISTTAKTLAAIVIPFDN